MDSRSLIDTALEVSVVGSFSRVGFQVRRRLFGWTPPPDGCLVGRTVLVTGPTSGLGRATADAVAALGARVILVGRSEAVFQQQLGGGLIWSSGDIVGLLFIFVATAQWMRASDREAAREDRRLDRLEAAARS